MTSMVELMDLLPLNYKYLVKQKYELSERSVMSKFGLYSEGPRLSIEDHLSRLDEPAKSILQEVRSFVLSLGSNVIEEVRPHRIVYAKSFVLRTFLDIEPALNFLYVSIKTGARGASTKLTINSSEQMQNLKEMIQQAYTRV